MRPERHIIVALGASVAGFAATLARADTLPTAPYVDQILYSSFDVHPLAGAAVLAGSVLLLVPATVGWFRDPANREIYTAFGAAWLAGIAAAALGDYPTPIVGYGGSAIIAMRSACWRCRGWPGHVPEQAREPMVRRRLPRLIGIRSFNSPDAARPRLCRRHTSPQGHARRRIASRRIWEKGSFDVSSIRMVRASLLIGLGIAGVAWARPATSRTISRSARKKAYGNQPLPAPRFRSGRKEPRSQSPIPAIVPRKPATALVL